jgi:hypothetical protein
MLTFLWSTGCVNQSHETPVREVISESPEADEICEDPCKPGFGTTPVPAPEKGRIMLEDFMALADFFTELSNK